MNDSNPSLTPLAIFSHSKETVPWGNKIRRLADVVQAAGWQVLSANYAALTKQADAPVQDSLAALLCAHVACAQSLGTGRCQFLY